MSWLNDELPTDWPSKTVNNDAGDIDARDSIAFSTSESGDSIAVDPTVAIQPNANTEQPQWKQAICAPKRNSGESSHRLTRMFVPPPALSQYGAAQPDGSSYLDNSRDMRSHDSKTGDGTDYTSTSAGESSSTRSISSHNDQETEPKRPISRRLKVFGKPDTYTNERLGNLLSSMGSANQAEGSSHGLRATKSAAFSGIDDKSTIDMSANESDVDLANNLQNEGRKVLQGLAPFRPNLSTVQESSLDQLEQQLTSQGTTPQLDLGIPQNDLQAAFETTSSTISKHDSSSQTLESLPPGLSNWDTIGGVFHDGAQRAGSFHDGASGSFGRKLLSKQSSRTLVGSGRSGKDQKANLYNMHRQEQQHVQQHTQQHAPAQVNRRSVEFHSFGSDPELRRRTQDIEAEISVLGIQEPISNVAENHHQYPESRRDTQQNIFTDPVNLSANNSIQQFSNEFSTTSEQLTTTGTNLDSDQARDPGMRTPAQESQAEPLQTSVKAFNLTPDHIARRYLQFDPPKRSAPSGHIHFEHNYAKEDSTQNSQQFTPDRSIAVKDISFSAGFEWLAQIIRERTEYIPTSSLETLDSLDLSNSDIESIVGLDQFVPSLTTLFLNDNSLRSLQGLPFNLVHLDISNNKLGALNTFPTSFISTLILSNNELENLEPLSNLRALSSLDVSNNKLKSTKGIEKLTALRTLNLRNNQLTSLDINLGMLVELDAAHNEISAVRLNAPILEGLDLEGNQVVAINEPLPNLQHFNIRFNGATVDFQGWQSLETVLFDGNKAVKNFDSVASMLVTFSWELPRSESGSGTRAAKNRNNVVEVSPHLLTSIRDLNLAGRSSGWPFSAEDHVFSAQHLDLSSCNIRELPQNLHRSFPFLRSLNLAFNKLDSRCIPILARCAHLERLSLFGNRLDISGEKLARKLPHLRVLDSRSQNRGRNLVMPGEYSTEVYTAITEADGKLKGSIVTTQCSHLQWIDGKWTNHAAHTKQITIPGFPSALYPSTWSPPSDSDALVSTTEEDISVIGSLNAWDIVEAAYVQQFLGRRKYGSAVAV